MGLDRKNRLNSQTPGIDKKLYCIYNKNAVLPGRTEGWRCTRGRRLVPHYRGSLFPRKGGNAMVTYSELFQFVIMITGIVGICYQIFGKRK